MAVINFNASTVHPSRPPRVDVATGPDAFASHIRQHLSCAPDPGKIVPGKWIHFPVSDKRGDSRGACMMFPDGEGGMYGRWDENSAGDWHSWQARQAATPEEEAVFRQKVEHAREEAERKRERERAECRERSAALWEKAQPANRQHPYLQLKGVDAHGLRQLNESLLVPVRDAGGTIHGLQFIGPDGAKRFKTGTAVSGRFHVIGVMQSNTILIAEGYATGATLHELSGHAVACAFNAGNLKPVAKVLRELLPDSVLIVCADDDHATEGNPGLTKATEAVEAVAGLLAVPTFPETRGPKDTDFNDLAKLTGPAMVKMCIETATQVGSETASFWPAPIDLHRLSMFEPSPPKFIMQDWLPCGYATLFAGHGGIGKSGIALMLAVCIAMGIPFWGMTVERCRVLYLSCEDREGVLHWRLARICVLLGITLVDLTGWLEVIDLVGHETILYQPTRDRSPLTVAYDELRNKMKSLSSQVLFVDGISDTYDGNENARAEVKAYINALLALISADDGAVVLVGHVSKPATTGKIGEGYSGSTGWHNSVRARWYLYPETKAADDNRQDRTGKLILELQKSNLGPTDRAVMFEWDDTAGLYAGRGMEEESNFDRNYRERQERDGILAVLKACKDHVPAATSGQRTAYHVLSAQPNLPESLLAGNAARKRFWKHVEVLRAMGLVEETSITRSDRHKMRVIVATDKACGDAGNA